MGESRSLNIDMILQMQKNAFKPSQTPRAF